MAALEIKEHFMCLGLRAIRSAERSSWIEQDSMIGARRNAQKSEIFDK
jgi:hypothetical protein